LPAEPKRVTPAPHNALPFRTLAFRQLEIEPDNWDSPSFEMTNLSTRTVIRVGVVVYAYDKSGKQLARSEHERVGPLGLEPGESWSGPLATVPISDDTVSFDVCYDFISFEGETSSAIGGTSDASRCPDQWIKGSGGAALDASGTLAQRRYHGVASPGAVHYATTEGLEDGASARGLADLMAHMTDFAGSNVRSSTPDYLDIPVLVGAVGVIYQLEGLTSLRLSPETLAKIFQRDITKWNDPAIAKDNPRTKLPDKPIIVFHEVGFEDYTDRDVDTTRAFVSYLRRAAPRAWHGGSPETFAWPKDMNRAVGLSSIVSSTAGAISFIEVSAAEPGSKFAAIRNRAGKYIVPNAASMRAAARELDVQTGSIEPKKADAYPIAFPSYVVVAAKQTDKARGTLVVAYLRTLLGEGQRKLESVGMTPLPKPIAAQSLELVERITLP
jgi:phosphate transport system substrate-binding protein